MNIVCRSTVTCKNGVMHSADPELDNCHADYAQRNAKELANLLVSANASVVPSEDAAPE